MMLFRKCSLVLLAFFLASALFLCTSVEVLAWSPGYVFDERNDTLTGSLGAVDLSSKATWDGSAVLYEYGVSNRLGNVGDIHVFMVDNPNGCGYSDASNDSGFTNPAFNPSNPTGLLEWLDGLIEIGGEGSFSYTSMYMPDVVPVQAMVIDGGTAAWGYTLGMGAPIPEPSCLAGMAGGLLSMSALYFRRGRKK